MHRNGLLKTNIKLTLFYPKIFFRFISRTMERA